MFQSISIRLSISQTVQISILIPIQFQALISEHSRIPKQKEKITRGVTFRGENTWKLTLIKTINCWLVIIADAETLSSAVYFSAFSRILTTSTRKKKKKRSSSKMLTVVLHHSLLRVWVEKLILLANQPTMIAFPYGRVILRSAVCSRLFAIVQYYFPI